LEETIQVKEIERKKKMLAVDVFTAVIGYFKRHLLGEMKCPVLSDVDIQWVITVPAIWDLKARTFMREAAKKVRAYLDDSSLVFVICTTTHIQCSR
jgi:hypothetical protein